MSLNLGGNHVKLAGVEILSSLLLANGDAADGETKDGGRGGNDSGSDSEDSDFESLRPEGSQHFGVRRQSGCALAEISFGFNSI